MLLSISLANVGHQHYNFGIWKVEMAMKICELCSEEVQITIKKCKESLPKGKFTLKQFDDSKNLEKSLIFT